VVAEIRPARRRTGLTYVRARARPPPDERFADDIAAALAQISTEGNDPWQALDLDTTSDRLRAWHD